MKTSSLVLRKTALAAAVVLLVGGVSTMDSFTLGGTGSYAWMSSAYAAQGSGGGGGQKGAMGEGRGGQGGEAAGGQGQRGGKSTKDVLAEEDDDSDRPPFAGVPGGEGRPGGGGNPQPGDTKGDDYGDLVLLLRNPITGEPALDEEGNLQVCTSLDCSTYVSMVDGEIPEGTTTFEVDFGRASVARSPTNVIEHSLDEALAKLTADGAVISTDAAGRITITVDGVTSTIDSPLENLALYIDLMEGLASEGGSATVTALGDLATLDTAASLLAGVADKTGDIGLDFVAYENVIAGIVKSGDFYEFTDFTYSRTYPDAYTVWYSPDGTVEPVLKTMDINDYLLAVNGVLPDEGDFAALFAAAADDALEVIELVHTQIVTDALLPEGFEFNE